MRHLEDKLQIACVRWFSLQHRNIANLLHHSPNGGYRTATEERDDVWASILALCMATPRDITPDGEDPVQCVNERLADLRELLGDAEYNLQALHDIRDGWETREED